MKTRILIFVCLALTAPTVFAQKRPPKPPPRIFTVRASAEVGKPGAWQETVSEPGGFRVEYPGVPASQKKLADVSIIPAPINSGSYSLQTPSVYYYLHFTEHFYDGEEPEKLKAIYDAKRESYLEGTSLKLTSESDVFLGKYLGRERVISDDIGTSITKSRLFLIKGILYELSATATKKALVKEQTNVDRFLGSFQLTDAPPKKPAMPDLAKVWSEFVSPEAEFKAAFPGKPIPRELPQPKDAKRKMVYYAVHNAGAEFAALITDYPYVVQDLDTLNSAYENLLSYFKEQPNQKVESYREVSAGKHLGREVLIKDFKKELTLRARVFVVGQRIYQLFVTTPLDDVSKDAAEFYDKTAAHFFDSFQLTGSTPAVAELAAMPLPANFHGETDEENFYRNEFFGFSLQLPEDWTILNQDEVGLAKEAGKTIFGSSDPRRNTALNAATKRVLSLVAASKLPMGTPENSLILIMAEKATNPANTPRDISLATEKSMSGNASVPLKIIRPTFTKKIGTVDFAGFETEVEAYGNRMRQQLYFTNLKGYVLALTLGYSKPEDLPALEAALQSLKFEAKKQ